MKTANQVSDLAFNLIMDLDIDAYDDIPVGRMFLTDPKTGAPTATYIDLASPEHDARKRIDLTRTRALRAEYANTGKMPTTDPLEEIEEQTDYLVASSLGWNLKRGGVAVPFTPENVRALYNEPKKKWVRAQAAAGLHKQALFIQGSEKK